MPKRKYADYDVRIVQFPDSGEPDRVRFYHEKCLPDGWRNRSAIGRRECSTGRMGIRSSVRSATENSISR